MHALKEDVREALGADSTWTVFCYRTIFNVLTVLFFIGAIIGFALAGKPDQLAWGSSQGLCSCKPVTYTTLRISPFAWCLATIQPNAKQAYPALKFTGDYGAAVLSSNALGSPLEYQLFSPAAPLNTSSLCDGLSYDTFDVVANLQGTKPGTPRRIPVPLWPHSVSCRRISGTAGPYRNIVLYNNSFDLNDPVLGTAARQEAPWNQQLRFETNDYTLAVMTVAGNGDPGLTDKAFPSIQLAMFTCLNLLDNYTPVHECTCALSIINQAIAITTIFFTATLPLRVLFGARANRLAKASNQAAIANAPKDV